MGGSHPSLAPTTSTPTGTEDATSKSELLDSFDLDSDSLLTAPKGQKATHLIPPGYSHFASLRFRKAICLPLFPWSEVVRHYLLQPQSGRALVKRPSLKTRKSRRHGSFEIRRTRDSLRTDLLFLHSFYWILDFPIRPRSSGPDPCRPKKPAGLPAGQPPVAR